MELLKEEIYLGSEKGITPNNKEYQIVYIDPDKSENTFNIKDKFKEYNMEYLPYYKYFSAQVKADLKKRRIGWGWVIWNGQNDQAWQAIKKFEQEVNSFEQPSGETPRTPEDVHESLPEIVKEMLKDIKKVTSLPSKNQLDADAKKKIADFENMITNELGNEKTQQFLENLIKYRTELRKHNIYNLGWSNMILVYLATNGEGTQVRPAGEWEKMGYTPKEGARPISLIGTGCKHKRYSPQEKEEVIKKYLERKGVKSVEELPQSAQYDLEHRVLTGKRIFGSEYNYSYIAYDIKDMVAGEGAETEPEEPEDNWWWSKLPEDEKDIALTNALIAFGESDECGNIQFNVNNSQQDLGGARGNATNQGVINLINDGKQRFPTACHELLHQLRHWPVASNNNPTLIKFYDRNAGRDIREQEAELASAFVSHVFGYDIQSQLNYLYNWGLSKNNAKAVFDKIAEIASFIENGVKKHLEDNNNF